MGKFIFENEQLADFDLINHIDSNNNEIRDFTHSITIKNSELKSISSKLLNVSSLKMEHICFTENNQEFSIILYCSTIYEKLVIDNCIFRNAANFFALHCLGEVTIKNCIFHEFVDFGDCWFKNKVTIKRNEFKKGTNLLGNLDKPYKVNFDIKPIIQENIGALNLNILP